MPSRPPVATIVELACLAPSVHNTQPWFWHVGADSVQLHTDRSRRLELEDPLGRNLMISCGAALDHFDVAARALGWLPHIDRLPEGPGSTVLADIRLIPAPRSETALQDLAALRDRCTDRRRFTQWPVPDDRLEQLAAVARRSGTHAVPVVDVASRFRLELAVGRAMTLRDRDVDAVAEQQHWTDHSPHDGVPRRVVPAELAATTRRSRFGAGLLEDSRRDIDGSDGLIVLGGDDDAAGWLRTGEGLSALWLYATGQGLSVVPLSQLVEVEETRHDVRDTVLGGSTAPHLLLRIGWQAIGRSQLPRTPRRPVEETYGEELPASVVAPGGAHAAGHLDGSGPTSRRSRPEDPAPASRRRPRWRQGRDKDPTGPTTL